MQRPSYFLFVSKRLCCCIGKHENKQPYFAFHIEVFRKQDKLTNESLLNKGYSLVALQVSEASALLDNLGRSVVMN